jgi:hypothetical protein
MIKPTKIGKRCNSDELLTSAEIGKLWATYMGNSMAKCVLSYFLNNVDDKEIEAILKKSLDLTNYFLEGSEQLFKSVNHPVPVGFTRDDVNVNAPRLFLDEFYLHYLRYAIKSGISVYSVGIPMIFRTDVREFLDIGLKEVVKLAHNVNDTLLDRALTLKPPYLPTSDKPEFAEEGYLNGFIGHLRPLHALEIAHLYDNIVNNMASNALLTAFTQTVKDEKIRKLFMNGKSVTTQSLEMYSKLLNDGGMPALPRIENLVTASEFPPFSDKLMLFHKVDMFTMKIRAIGNSLAVNGRHDIGLAYGKAMTKVSLFVQHGANLMIEKGWMEKVPHAIDRKK